MRDAVTFAFQGVDKKPVPSDTLTPNIAAGKIVIGKERRELMERLHKFDNGGWPGLNEITMS